MRRITIRNLKSQKTVKPHVFDVLVDEDEVFFEVKTKSNENEIIALTDIIEQISSSGSRPRKYLLNKPKPI